MSDGIVTIFGGTGFLGRHIVRAMLVAGKSVRVACRHPERGSDLPDHVEAVAADIRDGASVDRALTGARAAVNAVGLYVERGRETFHSVHIAGAHELALVAARCQLERLVHISGIGADPASRSAYVRARGEGEAAVREAFPGVTFLRPGVLFGPDDNFINMFMRMSRLMPVIPLFGDGGTRLQPVHVDDVALAVVRALDMPESAGGTYELGGPNVFTYRQLLGLAMARCGRRRVLMPWPFEFWRAQAWLASALPRPPITTDQVELMRHDTIVAPGAKSLADLGVKPTSLEDTLPDYAT